MNVMRILILICLLGALYSSFSQDDPNNLYLKKGKVIVSESAPNSRGDLQIVGYRLESVQPFLDREAKDPPEGVFRVVLASNGPLPPGGYSIWIDDNQLDAYLTKQNEVAALIYGRSLPNGVIKLALSRRNDRNPDDRLVLPGTLYVPPEYATPLGVTDEATPIVRLRRLARTIELSVEFPTDDVCRQSATALGGPTLEISGFQRSPRRTLFVCTNKSYVAWLTPDEYARIPDGAEIIMRRRPGSSTGGVIIGRVDKRTLP